MPPEIFPEVYLLRNPMSRRGAFIQQTAVDPGGKKTAESKQLCKSTFEIKIHFNPVQCLAISPLLLFFPFPFEGKALVH